MKTKIYLIPGMGENCKMVRYKKLAEALTLKGFEVVPINPDWYRPISEQTFPTEKDAIIFGFSMGAVLAYLVAEKYPCKKLILASISPIHTFTIKNQVDFYSKHMKIHLAKAIAKDIKSIKISFKNFRTPFVRLVGELEITPGEKADIVVPKTGHRITKTYTKYIVDLV